MWGSGAAYRRWLERHNCRVRARSAETWAARLAEKGGVAYPAESEFMRGKRAGCRYAATLLRKWAEEDQEFTGMRERRKGNGEVLNGRIEADAAS